MSDSSGDRSGLPPCRKLYWPAGESATLPNLAARHAAAGALLEGAAGRRPAVGDGAAARVGAHVEQVEALRQELFPHAGAANRPLQTAPQADVGIERPPGADAVGIGLLAVIVGGEAIAGVQVQFLRPGRVFDQRQPGFDEKFRHVEAAADGLRGTALAGAIAAAVGLVGFEFEVFSAVFAAHHPRRGRWWRRAT